MQLNIRHSLRHTTGTDTNLQRLPIRWRLVGLLAPGVLCMALFLLALGFIALYSVLTRGATGNIVWRLTGENYVRLVDWIYLHVLLRSVWMSAATTCACLVLGYPLALFIVQQPGRWRTVLVILMLVPFWTNFLVRTYAWMLILNHNGLINTTLQRWGFAPLTLINTEGAVLLGLIYGALPFMVLPIYASLDRFDWRLLEAAADLGASPWQAFRRVLLPLTLPGVAAGTVLVFIPTIGQFVVSDLLGGAKVALLGNLLQDQFKSAQHWPFGSAIAVVCVAVLALGVVVTMRTNKEEAS